jgi:hypothetical protein
MTANGLVVLIESALTLINGIATIFEEQSSTLTTEQIAKLTERLQVIHARIAALKPLP